MAQTFLRNFIAQPALQMIFCEEILLISEYDRRLAGLSNVTSLNLVTLETLAYISSSSIEFITYYLEKYKHILTNVTCLPQNISRLHPQTKHIYFCGTKKLFITRGCSADLLAAAPIYSKQQLGEHLINGLIHKEQKAALTSSQQNREVIFFCFKDERETLSATLQIRTEGYLAYGLIGSK
ncbi:MAG: hypothetical protein OXC40_05840 [Proteobacteria bacterium]|nr:hypothetical protein [Pseudomonadota bacterium]